MAIISGISGGISDPAFAAALARIAVLESEMNAVEADVAALEASPRKSWLWFGVDTLTAGTTDVLLNPTGIATTPAGAAVQSYPWAHAGNIVRVAYICNTAHTTNTVEVKARVNGVLTLLATITAADTLEFVVPTPLALSAGVSVGATATHGGATNVRRLVVGFEIEY